MTQQQQSKQQPGKLALREAVYAPNMLAQFARALPKGFPAERMAASIELAASNNPAIANCDLGTVLRSALAAAEFGWSVHWGPTAKCALVPYSKTCQLVVGYRGYIDLLARSPECKSIHSDLVREGDTWKHWTDQDGVHFKHVRGAEVLNEKMEDTRAVRLAYAAFYYRGGGCELVTSEKSDFEKVKNAVLNKMSPDKRASSPYTLEPAKMWQKRALRILANRAPITAEMQRAIDLEAENAQVLERDMGDAHRVDLSQAQPITTSLPATTRIPEVVEPPAEPAKVETQPAESKKVRIQDDSQTSDVLLQMRQCFEADDVPTSEQLRAWHANIPKDANRAQAVELYGKLQKRAKSAAEAQREPGAEG